MSRSQFLIASCVWLGYFAQARAAGEPRGRVQEGVASWYDYRSGRITASGERLDPNAMTAAHRTLPFGTKVRVTNLKTRATAVVRINDRGPFVKGWIIDLSKAAGLEVGVVGPGIARVSIEVVGD